MSYFRDSKFAAEPFQDDSPQTVANSEIAAFYEAQTKQAQALPRKAPKRMSSLWSRKVSTSKRSVSGSLPSKGPSISAKGSQSSVDLPLEHNGKAEPAKPHNEEPPSLPAVAAPIVIRSLVPDTLKELPAWYNKQEHNSTAFFRTRFPMHNPVGPRYYTNFHLIPPSRRAGASRPPSVFSPSFPAMAAATLQERSEDSTRIATPSRTPSESPLPTPSSSQTRVGEGKPRTRRPSQDNVDLMDVSDPWGQAWHHESPYDVGLTGGSTATDDARARRMSMSNVTDQRHRTVTPSPLSQSTSAVHLHHLPNTEPRIPRRLSKRRAPVVQNIFDGSNQRYNDGNGHSGPMNGDADGQNSVYPQSSRPSTRTSSFLHISSTKVKPPSVGSKEKRGSVLGRLVKRFSIMRRPANEQKVSPVIIPRNRSTSTFSVQRDPAADANAQEDLVPPSQDQQEQLNRISTGSFEPPFSMGRLTVANPDSPSTETTPRNGDADLPSNRHEPAYESDVRSNTTSMVSPPFAVMTLNHNVPTNDSRHVPSHSYESSHVSSYSAQANHYQQSDNGVDAVTSPVMTSPVSSPISSSPVPETQSPVERRPSSQYGDHERSRVRPQGGRKPSLPSRRASGEQSRSSVEQKQPSQRQSSRSPEKQKSPAPPMPQSRSAVVSSVTFPEELAADRAYIAALVSHGGMHDSPMSNASILANPPTPYNAAETPMPSTPGPPVPTKSPFPVHSKTLPPAHQSSPTRETETFKLVRSLSGNVYSSGETFTAAGQQWEVIEDKRGREGSSHSRLKSRSRDVDNSTPRKSKKTRENGEKARSPPRAPVQPSEPSVESAESRSRSREQKRSHKKSSSSTSAVHGSTVSPSKAESSRPLARNPSSSARPTSEVPTSADLNATRAREAWEMERLWKARSMYGAEGNSIPISAAQPYPQQYPESSSPPSHERGVHGSSHTSFVQQKPFESAPIYHSRPNPLPEPPRESTFIPPSSALPNNTYAANPLPEPPQESPYPLSPVSLYEANSTRSSEYWNRLTTAH